MHQDIFFSFLHLSEPSYSIHYYEGVFVEGFRAAS
jgi:hypothetical protein